MILEEYVTVETAKLLKQTGFPQDSRNYYDAAGNPIIIRKEESFAAPTQAQAMRWLREEEYINAYVIPKWDMMTLYVAAIFQAAQMSRPKRMGEFFTYEEAAEASIQAACRYLIEKGGKQ